MFRSPPFFIYINDLPHAVQNSAVFMNADDTSLCYQTSNINDLNEAINNDLMKLNTWLKSNKLSLNVAKTNCMLIITEQQQQQQHSYTLKIEMKI